MAPSAFSHFEWVGDDQVVSDPWKAPNPVSCCVAVYLTDPPFQAHSRRLADYFPWLPPLSRDPKIDAMYELKSHGERQACRLLTIHPELLQSLADSAENTGTPVDHRPYGNPYRIEALALIFLLVISQSSTDVIILEDSKAESLLAFGLAVERAKSWGMQHKTRPVLVQYRPLDAVCQVFEGRSAPSTPDHAIRCPLSSLAAILHQTMGTAIALEKHETLSDVVNLLTRTQYLDEDESVVYYKHEH